MCRYCGATLVASQPAFATTGAHGKEVYFVAIGRIGPSNRARIVAALHDVAKVDIAEAEKIVASAPCEIPFPIANEHVRALEELVREAGVDVTVETRFIADPVAAGLELPPVEVSLIDAGHKKIAVIKALRAHLDLGLDEAKHLVENAPCVLAPALEGSRARKFCEDLEAAGATTRLR